MKSMRQATYVLVFGLVFCGIAGRAQSKPEPLPLSEAILARIPVDYRDEVKELVKEPNGFQQRLAKMSDGQLAEAAIHALGDQPEASAFLLARLETEPSADLRSDIIRSLDTYWHSHPEDQTILERHLVSDPNADVSIAALTMLNTVRFDALGKLLSQRLALAASSGDLSGEAKLYDEGKQGIRRHYGTMLPVFLAAPVPLFSVAPLDKPIRVLAFGDFGTGSEAQKQTAAAMVEYNKHYPFDFGLTLGDNFYGQGLSTPDDPRWQTQWEQLYGPMGIKFYATLGNHDWGGADSPAAEILYTQKSPDWRMPSPYYTFTAGSVQFFAFDTPQVNEAELKWLDEELSKSPARWKIVYGHYHIFSATRGDNKELILRLLPILKKNHVDVYLNGHDHNLQELKPEDGVHFFVSGGGGAGLYNLNPYDRSVYKQKVNGFTVIEADKKSLKIGFVGTDGKELYQHTLNR
jgi:tartrate-resistant acid phosphatase type 5